MKILVCSANYWPEPTGIGKYSGEMCEWLARQGHEVRVVCAPPYYPAWRVADEYRGRGFVQETIHGVRVWRAPLWVPGRPGGLSRVLHLLSFAFTASPLLVWWGLRWRPDVVLSVAPFFTAAPGGLLAAKLGGARSWLHVQDFEIDVAFGMGLLKGGLLRRVVGGVERFIFMRFDRVSSISQRMLSRAGSKGVSSDRLVFFRNWVDVDAVQPQSRPSSYRAELGLKDETVVALFSGTLGGKQGLNIIPQAARLLVGDPRIQFVVCGDGPMKTELQALAEGLPNMRLLPLQPVERLGELLNLADIHLLPQDPAAEDLVLPSKLSGMLSSGRPVVATCAAETEIAITIEHCGMVTPPGDANALAQACKALADQPDERRRLGRNARELAERVLSRDGVLNSLLAAMRSVGSA